MSSLFLFTNKIRRTYQQRMGLNHTPINMILHNYYGIKIKQVKLKKSPNENIQIRTRWLGRKETGAHPN